MLMKLCIAAAVALGFTLAVPGASFAQGDKDKSAASTAAEPNSAKPSKATAQHKKRKKGFSDEVHNSPYFTNGVSPYYNGEGYLRRGQEQRGQPQQGQAR